MIRNAFLMGGVGMYFIAALLVVGLVVAFVALIVSLLVRGALVPGICAAVLVLISLSAVGTGLAFRMNGIHHMNRAIMNASIEPELKEQIRAQGTAEANVPLAFGFLAAAIPGLTGLGLGLLSISRRGRTD